MAESITKKCIRCKETKNGEDFSRDKREKDGVSIYCRACTRIKRTDWVARNYEKKKAKDRNFYARNSEKIKAYQKIHYFENSERIKEVVKNYNKTHKEEIKIKNSYFYINNKKSINERNALSYCTHREERIIAQRKYNAEHQEEIAKRQRVYARTHLVERQIVESRRRAKKAQSPVNDFTAQQWRDMQAAYDHRCVYCHKRFKGKLTQDHITPLSKGGAHTITNIVPACRSCNCRKQAGPVPTPIQPLLLV